MREREQRTHRSRIPFRVCSMGSQGGRASGCGGCLSSSPLSPVEISPSVNETSLSTGQKSAFPVDLTLALKLPTLEFHTHLASWVAELPIGSSMLSSRVHLARKMGRAFQENSGHNWAWCVDIKSIDSALSISS